MKKIFNATMVFIVISISFIGVTEASAAFSKPIGYIGCSNTYMIVNGYNLDGGDNFWPVEIGYSGGGITKWGNNDPSYWNLFTTLYQQNPGTKTIWLQVCATSTDSESSIYDATIETINHAKSIVPNAQIYVSAVNGYKPANLCHITGNTGVLYAERAVDAIIQNQIALAGPVMKKIRYSQTVDGCHPNTAGQKFLGQNLLNFFQ